MKSQDILLLLKLVSLERRESLLQKKAEPLKTRIPEAWRGWRPDPLMENEASSPSEIEATMPEVYSARSLAASTGISKSEISSALRRCFDVGLARQDRKTSLPKANTKALLEFISYGLKYVFPAKKGALVRGIPTAASAPVLEGQLLSAGSEVLVWEDAQGSMTGQLIKPLYASVPFAVRNDPDLYGMLALVDSIRIGHEREMSLARNALERYLGRNI